MSRKPSLPQDAKSVSVVLTPDSRLGTHRNISPAEAEEHYYVTPHQLIMGA